MEFFSFVVKCTGVCPFSLSLSIDEDTAAGRVKTNSFLGLGPLAGLGVAFLGVMCEPKRSSVDSEKESSRSLSLSSRSLSGESLT